MADGSGDEQMQVGGLLCPRCGRPPAVGLLDVVADDKDEPETLVLLECPNRGFHGTVTRKVLLELFAAEVMARLR